MNKYIINKSVNIRNLVSCGVFEQAERFNESRSKSLCIDEIMLLHSISFCRSTIDVNEHEMIYVFDFQKFVKDYKVDPLIVASLFVSAVMVDAFGMTLALISELRNVFKAGSFKLKKNAAYIYGYYLKVFKKDTSVQKVKYLQAFDNFVSSKEVKFRGDFETVFGELLAKGVIYEDPSRTGYYKMNSVFMFSFIKKDISKLEILKEM